MRNFDDLTLKHIYKEGLYVFGGWHELVAHRELHKLYPQEDPPYSLAQNCTIYVFDTRSAEVVENIRIVGSAQNTFEAARQKMTVWDHLMDARREMIKRRQETGNKHYKLVMSEKVFFDLFFIGFLIFCLLFFGSEKVGTHVRWAGFGLGQYVPASPTKYGGVQLGGKAFPRSGG